MSEFHLRPHSRGDCNTIGSIIYINSSSTSSQEESLDKVKDLFLSKLSVCASYGNSLIRIISSQDTAPDPTKKSETILNT